MVSCGPLFEATKTALKYWCEAQLRFVLNCVYSIFTTLLPLLSFVLSGEPSRHPLVPGCGEIGN